VHSVLGVRVVVVVVSEALEIVMLLAFGMGLWVGGMQ
jgi:hypothetical protein